MGSRQEGRIEPSLQAPGSVGGGWPLLRQLGAGSSGGAVHHLLCFSDPLTCPVKDVGVAGKPITIAKTVLLQFPGASQQNSADKA